MLFLYALVRLEGDVMWFPINNRLRYTVVWLHILSDRPIRSKVKTYTELIVAGKKPFRDSFENEIKGKRDVFLLHEMVTSWDTVFLKGTVKINGKDYIFKDTLQGYGNLKTSSLVLAYRISKNDPSALIRRGEYAIRPCFTCIFYGYVKAYLEVLSPEPFVLTGAIVKDGITVTRIPPRNFSSSQNLNLTFPIHSLDEGNYELVLNVVSPSLQEGVELRRHFILSKYGDNIASFIDYIATDEELREFRKLLGVEERINFLRRFWSKRGDAFYMEFRRRVIYADSAFSTSNRLGRYTDMGRIYIKRGSPDEVTRADLSESNRPYIKWVYYTGGGYTYYFYDPIGTGEYVLVKTDDPEEAVFGPRNINPTLDFDEGSGWEE